MKFAYHVARPLPSTVQPLDGAREVLVAGDRFAVLDTAQTFRQATTLLGEAWSEVGGDRSPADLVIAEVVT